MGGFGSGRWARSDNKGRTVDYKFVDVRCLARFNALEAGTEIRFDNGESLKVISSGLSLEVLFFSDNFLLNGRVSVRFRPCALGGQRATFECPDCDHSAFILYRIGTHYKCHRCSGLVYKSQQEDALTRSISRVNRLLRKIDPSACLMTGIPDRPLGMHKSTYARHSVRASLVMSSVIPQWNAVLESNQEAIKSLQHIFDSEPL